MLLHGVLLAESVTKGRNGRNVFPRGKTGRRNHDRFEKNKVVVTRSVKYGRRDATLRKPFKKKHLNGDTAVLR